MKVGEKNATRPHAEVGSSSAKGHLGCVGYIREKMPKTPHPNTVIGSRIHDALEEDDFSDLDPLEQSLADSCLRYVAQFGPYTKEVKEGKVTCVYEDHYGYYDLLAFRSPEYAHMFDWKFGYRKVDDAKDNPQGWFLAIGIFDQYPELKELWVHLVQPRLGHMTKHKFTRADADQLKLKFINAQRLRKEYHEKGEPIDMLTPSFDVCEFCGNYQCKFMKSLAAETAQIKGNTISVPDTLEFSDQNDPVELAKSRDLAELMSNWADGAKWDVAQKRIEEGIEIPGYKLVHRDGGVTVKDNKAVVQAALQRGVPADKIDLCITISFSKLKKVVDEYGDPCFNDSNFESSLIESGAIEAKPDSSYLKREPTN